MQQRSGFYIGVKPVDWFNSNYEITQAEYQFKKDNAIGLNSHVSIIDMNLAEKIWKRFG